jgi:hypothetical protein
MLSDGAPATNEPAVKVGARRAVGIERAVRQADALSMRAPDSSAVLEPPGRVAAGSAALRALLLAGAAVHAFAAAVFVWIASHRVAYPLELGHVEGVLMDTVRRFTTGQPVYPAPGLDFTPLAYMPGYFMTVAALAQLFGTHLWVGRAVALAETLLIALLLARTVRRETGSRALALIGPGIFLGAYGFCGGSYDLVQPNSQMILLALAGFALLRERTGVTAALAAAACFGLAFLSKQHGLIFGLAALPWLYLRDRRRLVPYAAMLALCAGGGYALFLYLFGPWFSFYTYDVPSHWSEFDLIRLENMGRYVFGVFGVSVTLAVAALLQRRPKGESPHGVELWWWAALGGLGTGVMATLDPYAYRHTLMPMVTMLALVAPLAAWRLASGFGGLHRPVAIAAVLWLLVPQYVPLLFSIRHYLPRADGWELREAFYERLHRIPGRAMILNHGFYLADAGERPSVHLLAIDDIIRARGNRLLAADPAYFERAFASLETGTDRPWLVTDVPLERVGDVSSPHWIRVARAYALTDSFGPLTQALLPTAGLQQAPRYIYAPR